jgi:hypothetical protein
MSVTSADSNMVLYSQFVMSLHVLQSSQGNLIRQVTSYIMGTISLPCNGSQDVTPRPSEIILQHLDTLLDNDTETNSETRSATRQQIRNEQIYAAVNIYRLRKQAFSHGNESTPNNWGTVGDGAFCAVRAMGLSMGQVQNLVQLGDRSAFRRNI